MDIAANDGKRLREGLIDPGLIDDRRQRPIKCCTKYWGAGYRAENGLNSRIHRKKPYKRPMSTRTAKANGRKSSARLLRPHDALQ